jgi:hypothetical protein
LGKNQSREHKDKILLIERDNEFLAQARRRTIIILIHSPVLFVVLKGAGV